MGSTNRQKNTVLTKQLFDQSRGFSFYQAYRLIYMLLKQELGNECSNDELMQQIRIRPELSLDFPTADVSKIEKIQINGKRGYQITVTFLGLYGTSSPLPTFYTERLFREQAEDNPLAREFIDILNNHLYQLFFKIWSNHRLSYQAFETNNLNYLTYLYSIGGIVTDKIESLSFEKYNILRHIGLMGHLPRSALGLKILLSNLLEIKQIEIDQCRTTVLNIPKEQQLCLGINGNELGNSTHLGNKITSASHHFRIVIGPIHYSEYMNLIPGSEKFLLLKQVVSYYIGKNLDWDLELKIIGNQLASIGLGNPSWSHLGHDTWLFADKLPKATEYAVCFNPVYNNYT